MCVWVRERVCVRVGEGTCVCVPFTLQTRVNVLDIAGSVYTEGCINSVSVPVTAVLANGLCNLNEKPNAHLSHLQKQLESLC